ncbi:Hpt domain-containing protein [Maricaulis sp.]|uniref:Hpt domain-containing protein n=1 Tax=unclassified Maricaulis TaxID=2632371 RepID=UPI001B261417|nr:Hpt domain-containing protein [Maricaulis sp.]MBO6796777.1 Hpt domain-containing protein [Maricaulis sp.]
MVAELKSGGSPLFDHAHLLRYTGEDVELQRELVSLMLDQADRCVGMMGLARERSEWRTAVHTLKGSSRGVGAFALGDLCDEAEELPALAWPGARVQIEQMVAQTRSAFGELAD